MLLWWRPDYQLQKEASSMRMWLSTIILHGEDYLGSFNRPIRSHTSLGRDSRAGLVRSKRERMREEDKRNKRSSQLHDGL